MTQIFEIEGRLPALNDYIKLERTPKFGYVLSNQMKKKEQEKIGWAILKHKLKPISNSCFISFTWIEPNAKRDLDNIAWAKKFILDSLVKQKILPNDNRQWVKGFLDKFPESDKNNPKIIVKIEETT